MDFAPEPLEHPPEDLMPLTVEDLSRHACLSLAFIRLCIQSGCPAPGGLVSQAAMVHWLCANYGIVRDAAGLSTLSPIDGVTGDARCRLEAANTMLTMLEFTESRCSDPVSKARLRSMRQLVERAG